MGEKQTGWLAGKAELDKAGQGRTRLDRTQTTSNISFFVNKSPFTSCNWVLALILSLNPDRTNPPTQTRKRATRAHSKPRAHMKTRTWWEYQGSVTKPWITLDRSDRTLTHSMISADFHTYTLKRWFPKNTNCYLLILMLFMSMLIILTITVCDFICFSQKRLIYYEECFNSCVHVMKVIGVKKHSCTSFTLCWKTLII